MNCFIHCLKGATRNYEGLGKIDYTLGRHQLMASAFFVNYSALGWNGNNTLLNYGLGQEQTTSEGKFSDTFSINPHLVNSFVADMLVLNSNQNTRRSHFRSLILGIRVLPNRLPSIAKPGSA